MTDRTGPVTGAADDAERRTRYPVWVARDDEKRTEDEP
jgi:hypothetical protein